MGFDVIFKQGVLVDINIHKWLGKRKLTPEDMGIPKESVPPHFTLGEKYLIPKDVLNNFHRIDERARALLKESSFEFPFGDARYIPKKGILEFDKDFNEIKKLYDNAVDDLVKNYHRYRLEMRSQFLDAAKRAYATACKVDSSYLYNTDEDGKRVGERKQEAEYINEFIQRISECYPAQEQVKNKFSMSYISYHMQMPDLIEGDYEDFSDEIEQRRILQEGYRMRMEKELESYAEDIVKENRERIHKVISGLKNRFEEGGRYTITSHNKVLKAIKYFRRLNVSEDSTIEECLVNIENILKEHNPNDLIENQELQAIIVRDVQKLEERTKNEQTLDAVINAYKQKMGV